MSGLDVLSLLHCEEMVHAFTCIVNHFHFKFLISCICRLLKPADIGLNELFSSDAIHGYLYGPPVNVDKAIYHPGALRKVSTLHFYFEYEHVD